jgi:uncharacterized protein YutE (UPF0331/DUF86 family)
MFMANEELLKRKINSIEEYIREIAPTLQMKSADEIIADVLLLRAVERNFQLIVDTMLDINTHIIAADGLKSPSTNQETFLILVRAGVLEEDLVKQMAPVVGLRNKIVHEYEGISTEKFIADIKQGLSQFGRFVVCIDDYLQKEK